MWTYGHTDTRTHRNTDLQTHRHTDTQTHIQTDVQAYGTTVRGTDGQVDKQINQQTVWIDKQMNGHTWADIQKDR